MWTTFDVALSNVVIRTTEWFQNHSNLDLHKNEINQWQRVWKNIQPFWEEAHRVYCRSFLILLCWYTDDDVCMLYSMNQTFVGDLFMFTLCDLNSNKVIRYRRVFVCSFNTTKLHYTEGVYTLWGNGVLYLCNVVIGQCYIPLRVQAKITEYGINDGTCNVLQYL